MTSNNKEWITPLIKVLVNECWEAYQMKRKVRCEIAKDFQAKNLQNGKHGVWRLVRHVTNKSRKAEASPLVKKFGSVEELLNGLKEHFAKIASGQETHEFVPPCLSSNSINPSAIIVTETEIKRFLEKTIGKTPRCDSVPNKVYIILADYIYCKAFGRHL